MAKQPGKVARRRLSFDLLEERSLLSGLSITASRVGMIGGPPPGSSVSYALAHDGQFALNSYSAGWSQRAVNAPIADSVDSGLPMDAYGAPAGGAAASGGFAMFFEPSDSVETTQISGISANPSPTFGSAVPAPARGPATAAEPGSSGLVANDLQVANPVVGVTPTANKDAGAQPNGVSGNQVGVPASSVSGRLLGLFDGTSAGITAKRLSPGDEDSGSSALHGVGTDRDATGGLGLSSPRAAIRGSAALVATGLAFDSASDEKPDDLPRPGSADLLANALPFASGSLARAIDRLFQQFESVNAGEPVWQRPLRLALYSAVMACTFAAMDAVRRWRGRGMAPADLGAHDREAIANHSGFPELPGSWSSRLS